MDTDKTNIPKVLPYCEYKGNPVYNKKAVCILFQCSEETIEDWVARGLLKCRKVGIGRYTVGFFEKDLDAFLAK